MANKLLILGAAMAHKNKSYNLGIGIGPTVDKSVAKFQKILSDRQARLNNSTQYAQRRIDKLDADPELDLLPEGIKDLFVTDLDNTRKTLGQLYTEKDLNAYKYRVGTDEYTQIQKEISKHEKKLKKRQKQANDFLQKRANWITEHGDISETFKLRFPDQYHAMINIFDPENPQYTASFDENDDLIFEAPAAISIPGNIGPGLQGQSTGNFDKIKMKLDDLDWGQFPQPEIMKINEFYEVAENAGAQGREIPAGTLQNMRIYLDNVIKKNENAVYSLLFDDLPIGNSNNKMPLFTDEDFAEMFPNFNESDESTWPDFEQLKDAAVNKLISNIEQENKNFKNKSGSQFAEGFNDFAFNYAEFKSEIASMQNSSEEEILKYIEKDSPYSGIINATDKDGKIFFGTGSAQTQALRAFDVNNQIKIFKDTGNITPLITKLIRELYAGDDQANNITQLISQFENLPNPEQQEFFSDILRGTN